MRTFDVMNIHMRCINCIFKIIFYPVAPMTQESTNQVTQPLNLASPIEEDRVELMVSGQRARDIDEPFSEQLDSGLGRKSTTAPGNKVLELQKSTF